MNAFQLILLGFGVTGLVLLLVLWLVFSYRRMQREQDAILQERDRLLRAAELNIREAERLLRTSNQPTGSASPRMAAPQPVARPAAPRPAPTASRVSYPSRTPTRHRGYSRQPADVDNSPVVASLLIDHHDSGYHYSDYSDSCGGGFDSGGFDGGGCDCGGGCD